MKKELQLCSFEQAQRLKKAGFDWEVGECYFEYDKRLGTGYKATNHNFQDSRCRSVSAPTVALALKWIRDEKGIVNCIKRDFEYSEIPVYLGQFKDMYITDYGYDTYEEAESALLDELLNILEKSL